MEITIKRIGKTRGTVGWLSAGLADGSLKIEEGKLARNGNHSLWLMDYQNAEKKREVLLAAWNEWGVPRGEGADDEICYKIVSRESRRADYTDACWSALLCIARAWCKEMNAEIDAEEVPSFEIKRVSLS